MSALSLRNPLIFSLDVSNLAEAEKWVFEIGSLVGCIKLGPRILLQASRDWIREISKVSPLFFDCKFFDIPSTVTASVETCFDLGASIVTVHALNGASTLSALSKLQNVLSNDRPFLISPVTILTSFSQIDLSPSFASQSLDQHVQSMINLVTDSGLSSLVCSPLDASFVRSRGLLPITPGIRSSGESKQDQYRTLSAKEAIRVGAWALVIGRPILNAQDPKLWVSNCLQELKN